jgi:hypothetical protein
MHRRDLLKASAAAAGLFAGATNRSADAGDAVSSIPAGAPAILAGYTAAEHRSRLANIGLCQRAIRTCLRKHLITGYLPGQCCYNLGEYPPEERCFWTRHCRAIWQHYQANPKGPLSYGWWDSVPGRPEARPTHARWLKQYLPMVEEGTWAWLEIGQSDLFRQALPKDVVASAFANRESHLVLANYATEPVQVETCDEHVAVADAAAVPQTTWRLEGRSLSILRRCLRP